MNNEEFQKLVLEKLNKLDEGQKSFEEGQKKLEREVKDLKRDVKEIKHDVKAAWGDILLIDNRLSAQEEMVEKIAK